MVKPFSDQSNLTCLVAAYNKGNKGKTISFENGVMFKKQIIKTSLFPKELYSDDFWIRKQTDGARIKEFPIMSSYFE